MKIVINKSFGGFSLSPKAVKRMAELNGKKCYFFKGGLGIEKYKEVLIKDIKASLFWSAFSVKHPDKYIVEGRDDDGSYKTANESYDKISLSVIPEDRSDPILIQVVEELKDEANGRYAELEIVEIPDDVKWELDNYDGIESVHEVHRSW